MATERERDALVAEIVDALRTAAVRWVEQPGDSVGILADVPRLTFHDRDRSGKAVSWSVLHIVAHCLHRGDVSGLGVDVVLPAAERVDNLVRAFSDFAAVRLAELCIEATGADPRIVADADGEIAAELHQSRPAPADAVKAEQWMVRHWGSPLRRAAVGRLLGGYYRAAFQRLALEQAARREQEARNALQRTANTALGLSVKIPQVVVRGWEGDHFTALQERIDQRELFATPEAGAVVQDAAQVLLDRSQLGNLSTGQVRALMAVFRIFTTDGEDSEAQTFRAETLTIPALTLYKAAGLTNRGVKVRQELFEALDELAARELYLAVVVSHPDRPGGLGAGPMVCGERTPLFKMRPYWFASDDGRKKGRADVASIVREWGRRGMRADKPAWTGPLPDFYEIQLPPLVRRIGSSLVMSAEVLDRLDHGSKIVRGPTQGFTSQDFRLWMEITQRTQADQPSADGLSLRSYVDRDALLRDIHGEEKIAEFRRRGKLRRYIEAFEKSAAVMEAGKLAIWETRDQQHETGRGGMREVFIPDPELIAGLSKRAKGAVKRATQRQLALGTGEPNRR